MITKTLLACAEAARPVTLNAFRTQLAVENKLADGFDPVTDADRGAETAIRAVIAADFPEHGIIGEEWDAKSTETPYNWIIDPIDGTRAFISGVPVWGTLVGLTAGGDAVAGMMAQPFTGELFYATGGKAFYEGPGGAQPLQTRGTTALADATLCTTTPMIFSADQRKDYDRLEKQVRLPRYGTDCYAYAMLAAGFVDLVVETGLHPYDIVALVPIIEKAGGVITTWDGGPAEKAGNILAAATRELHAKALELLTR